jgi:FAD/FMN-containing dehydrogenase
MAIVVSRQDPRYEALSRGHNLRWPAVDADAAARIVLCQSPNDAAEALQQIVSAGMRPTVRSGAHCYEDFVANNPNGAILDMSLLNEVGPGANGAGYRVQAGTMLWDVYVELYKRYGVTLPGGSCGTVGAGGHISGGGYGWLSRLHGLTCDWLTSVDILTVDAQGKVIARTVDATHDADLFRACRGAGGGNFGVITSYNFDKLPPAPVEVMQAYVEFLWADTSVERFVKIMKTFGEYWEKRGQEPDTWGLFSVMNLSHQSHEGFGISVQFFNPDGTSHDLTVLNEYLDLFVPCGGVSTMPGAAGISNAQKPQASQRNGGRNPAETVCVGQHTMRRRTWFSATGDEAGGPGSSHGKYKSVYMKRGFSEAEARCMYKHMHRTIPGVNLRGSVFEIDSYGGAINKKEMLTATSASQRSSIIKMQPMTFWSDPQEEAPRSQWIRDFYTELYSGPDADPQHPGVPYPGDKYEGCYINYPDRDMLAYPCWPQLYYGAGDLYPFLQEVKRKYDPNNIFHHAMSIRV